MLRFISITTFPSQMNRMRCSLLRSIVTAIAMYSHSGSRAIITNPTMLSSLFSDTTNVRVTGQYVHTCGRYSCQAHIPARIRPNKNRQRSATMTHNSMVNGVPTDSVDVTMAPTTRPFRQRRARSGRLRSHGHRAPSPPSVHCH